MLHMNRKLDALCFSSLSFLILSHLGFWGSDCYSMLYIYSTLSCVVDSKTFLSKDYISHNCVCCSCYWKKLIYRFDSAILEGNPWSSLFCTHILCPKLVSHWVISAVLPIFIYCPLVLYFALKRLHLGHSLLLFIFSQSEIFFQSVWGLHIRTKYRVFFLSHTGHLGLVAIWHWAGVE